MREVLSQAVRSCLRRQFALDVRSLAAFRIGVALLLLGDLAIRVRSLRAHYTDAGVLPTDLLDAPLVQPYWWSFHAWATAPHEQAVLFALAAVLAVALLLGWRTRLVTVLSWVLLVSLQNRNPLVLHAGDTVLRLCVFWAMFLPLGAHWSLDRMRSGARPEPALVFGIPTIGLVVQLSVIYVWSGIWKLNPMWRDDATALQYALAIGSIATPTGQWLLQFPDLLRLLAPAVVFGEILLGLALFIPLSQPKVRIACILSAVALHGLLGLCFSIGLFSYAMVVAWLPLIPSSVWGKLVPSERPAISSGFTVGPVVQLASAMSLLLVVLWNVHSTWVHHRQRTFLPEPVKAATHVLRLEQKWNMFAWPWRDDGWWIARARLKNGEVVDVLRQQPLAAVSRPTAPDEYVPDYRWRRYLRAMWDMREFRQRAYFAPLAEYFCRQWNNSSPPDRMIEELDLIYVVEFQESPNVAEPPQPVILWRETNDSSD